MAIYNSALCNCHKEDEFSPLVNLVEMGYMFLNKARKRSDQLSFGFKLRAELEKFINKFVPHMKEEEKEFQPLLLQHFTIDELKEMKNTVIKLHLQKRKRNSDNIKEKTSKLKKLEILPLSNYQKSSLAESPENKNNLLFKSINYDSSSISFNELPNEIILKIFSFLTFVDKFKSTRVCKKWYNTIYDPQNWNELCFAQWYLKSSLSESSNFKNTFLENIQSKKLDYELYNESNHFSYDTKIDMNKVFALKLSLNIKNKKSRFKF